MTRKGEEEKEIGVKCVCDEPKETHHREAKRDAISQKLTTGLSRLDAWRIQNISNHSVIGKEK